jgi:hypothetical protein
MPMSELFPYGKTIAAVMKHRGETDAAHLDKNIDAILTEKVEKKGMAALTQEERNVYLVQAMNREVNSGGFELFFHSAAGAFAPELVTALGVLGLPVNQTIAAQALLRFGMPPSWSDEDRRRHLDEITLCGGNLWERLDEAYYEFPEMIEEKILDYIAAHEDQFE